MSANNRVYKACACGRPTKARSGVCVICQTAAKGIGHVRGPKPQDLEAQVIDDRIAQWEAHLKAQRRRSSAA